MSGERGWGCEMRRGCVAVFVLVALWAAARSGAAQSAQATAEDPAYLAVIDKALLAFNQGHWTEAKVFFSEAHALQPSARTLRGMGLASYESRSYVAAIEYLEQAMVSRVHALTPEMRMLAAELIAEARQFVTRVRVALSPTRATLRVDGRPAQYDREGAILLDPGEHELLATAAEFRPLRRRVESEGGRELRVRMVLERKPLAGSGGGVTAFASADSRETTGPWLVVAGSSVLAAAGGIVLGYGLSAKAEVEGAEADSDYASVREAHDSAVPLQVAGGIMLGVGVAGVLTGLALRYWPESGERRPAAAVALGANGLSWSGSF